VTTPLPGTILDVFVNVGDQVKAGQRVVLLEAMKMENNIEADTDGTVTAVEVRKGDAVLEGQTLVVIG
jgi:biotin carboxyl carrier protein